MPMIRPTVLWLAIPYIVWCPVSFFFFTKACQPPVSLLNGSGVLYMISVVNALFPLNVWLVVECDS